MHTAGGAKRQGDRVVVTVTMAAQQAFSAIGFERLLVHYSQLLIIPTHLDRLFFLTPRLTGI